ncbi:lipoprotein [Spiroplasma citri]|uniref:Lipoprotein n=1 Tax=Spiroplasma citri TaxID=2133 RepID=A0AAJ4EKB9_SPICI|nr:lipoprotein [Spiroplasma citri]QED25274.1 hypothetical protein FRX96_08000 [Spiroplasma citri]QIA67618.1 hypothetical protein GMI18_08375 [Spiroplasma citri]QIA69467.1 hypothetical protein GL298_08290 [Spiroplasma citri]QIA71332.1 lipoprotein [Spiroplasma citri]QIA73465.1 lipoprotein [Spiroplasma citri]
MKKWLSFLGAITLLGTSTTNLVACNNIPQYNENELQQLKKENQIWTNCQEIKENLEWICSQEKPFNQVDNKWYYVVCRGNENDVWEIAKFKNDFKDNKFKVIKKIKNGELSILYNMDYGRHLQVGYNILKKWISNINNKYFKAVYRWNGGEENLPVLVVNNDGNVKVNGE